MSILNPSTFLELVQRSLHECQIATSTLSITTTVDADGQALDFCNWVNESWKEIQGKHTDWGWKLVSPGVSFVTVAGQQIYTPAETGVSAGVVAQWRRNTVRNYLTSGGTPTEVCMQYDEYDRWRDQYLIGALRTAQVRPQVFSIRPSDQALCLQTPLSGYTITADYFSAPTVFDADNDTPDIPASYIMAIVYRTMMFYGAAEGDGNVYNSGSREFNKMMARLANTRMFDVEGAGALA